MVDEKSLSTSLAKVSSRYGDQTVLRALIQAIPYLGGPLDTLLANGGVKWKMERIESFIQVLDERMKAASVQPKLKDMATSEELYDLVQYSLEQVTKTRSADRRRSFANIVHRQIMDEFKWEEPEIAAHLLADLNEMDVQVLNCIAHAPVCGAPFDGLRVAELELETPLAKEKPSETFKPLLLLQKMPSISRAALRMCCSGLVSRGLLKDEGVGRWGGVAMRYFVATESAYWFLKWIEE